MKFVKPENYILIQGWMLELGCSNWNELAAFALVYGFSQDSESDFQGSISYMQEWLGCSRHTAINTIKALEEKGLIVKRQITMSGVSFNRYKSNITKRGSAENALPVNRGSANTALGSANTALGSANTALGSANTAPNKDNIIDNINIVVEDNNNTRISTTSSPNTSNVIIPSTTKKEKEKKVLDLSFVSIHFQDVFERWLAYHKELGRPYKQMGAEGAYRKLVELSNNDPHTAQEIVEQSISNNWQGLFPLKNNNNGSNRSNSKEEWARRTLAGILE